jgi:acetyl-CoA C-acetyltransferase/3-oxo-5,6-didehydrosuberyl-CoA/3-oxoadipyl-CoA thiolase
VNAAFHAIATREGDTFVAGGVESMSRAPFAMLKSDSAWPRGAPEIADTVLGWRFINARMPEHWTVSLGETAELVAADHGITREEQDAFAAESQRRAAAAIAAGRFDAEITPVDTVGRKGEVTRVDQDEHPRPGTTVDQLARLRPVFRANGTVTAGNSSGLNDGAAALLVVAAESGRALGLTPIARIVSSAVAGVAPDRMGMGPVPATYRALQRAGIGASDLDLIEINEAFAAQSIPCMRELGLDPDRVNVSGGAIALGHPLGMSGTRLLLTAMNQLEAIDGRYALCTMCIGVGQGIAGIIERV